MSVIWIVVGLGLAIVVSAFAIVVRRTDQRSETGAVSHRWLLEHRNATIHDSPR